jgi:hypothetical protein
MRNQKKNIEPPMLSYQGTFVGLARAVWLPLLVLVVSILLIMITYDEEHLPIYYLFAVPAILIFVVPYLAGRYLKYMISRTQYYGEALSFGGKYAHLVVMMLVVMLILFMLLVIALATVHPDGSSLWRIRIRYQIVIVALIQASNMMVLVYLFLVYITEGIGKKGVIGGLSRHESSLRLFGIMWIGFTLRGLLYASLLNLLQIDGYTVDMIIPPFLLEIEVVRFPMNKNLIMSGVMLLSSLVWLRIMMGCIVGQLVVQGKRLAIKTYRWLLLAVLGWFVVMELIIITPLGDLTTFLLLLLISFVLLHTLYRLVLRQLCYADQRVGKD